MAVSKHSLQFITLHWWYSYLNLMSPGLVHSAISGAHNSKPHAGTCKPSLMPGLKHPGFCVSLDDLRNNACGDEMELSSSPDCGELERNLCCYAVDTERQAEISANRQSSSATGASPRQCGWPSTLPVYPTDGIRQHGTHFGYLVFKNTSVTTNPVYYYATMVGRQTRFPGTDVSADVQDVTQFFYDSPSSPCHGRWGPYWIAVDGRVMGIQYDSQQSNTVLDIGGGRYLYDDYITMEIFTSCYAVNSKTGMCTDPDIYVNTRTRPDQLTAQEKARIDQIVDSTLKPYCLSKADLLEHQWTDALPLCFKHDGDICYARMMQGIKDDIANGEYVDNAN